MYKQNNKVNNICYRGYVDYIVPTTKKQKQIIIKIIKQKLFYKFNIFYNIFYS